MLAVYLLTLAPTLTWAHYGADGGDLATAVVLRRLPHPPGFPAYLLLGEAFVRLPWGDPARRLNLLSAVSGAAAAGLMALVVPAPAALCLGLAPLLWSQAVITEVYSPATCCAALVTVLALLDGPAWALGLAWGVGLGVHPTLVFLAPLVLRRGRWAALPFALAAVGVLYGPVLLVYGRRPTPWGDVSTIGGWWEFVTGRLYHGYLFGLPAGDYPRRVWAWVGVLARQFTPVGGALAALGLARLWREERPLAVATVGAAAGVSLYAIGYDTGDSLVYLTPVLPLLTVWLGWVWQPQGGRPREGQPRGLPLPHTAGRRGRSRTGPGTAPSPGGQPRGGQPRGLPLLLLLPVLQAVMFWGAMDVSDDYTALDWATRVLESAPARAVLLTAQDRDTFALWYVHDALGVRPDVAVVDVDLQGTAAALETGRPRVPVRSGADER